MVAMSNETDSNAGDAQERGEVHPVDFEGLENDVMQGMGNMALIKSKSGWSAIVLPMREMPGEGVAQTVGLIFSGGPAPMQAIQTSLSYMKLGIMESTETDGGVRLEDLSFGEWLDLLEQWANT